MALFSCKIGYELSIGIGFEAFEAVYCFGPRWQFDSSNATICMMRHYSNIRVQGSRTCTSAVPPTNISRQQIPSTATKQRSKLQELSCCCKFHALSRFSRDLNPQQPLSSCGSKPGFLPCKEEDKLHHPCKMSKQSHNTCKHYRMSLSFLFCRICHCPSTS